MINLKTSRFTVSILVVLIFCAGLLIFSFRSVFNAISVSYDVNTAETNGDKIQETRFQEAKNFALGQKTLMPLNIKPNDVPITSITVTPKPTPK
jgi:hypothetical protein